MRIAILFFCSCVCAWSVSLEGATTHKIMNFACSPDRQHLAIEHYAGEEGEDGRFRLFLYDRLTHELTDTKIDTSGRYDCLSWSADGERLAIEADGLEVVERRSLRRRRLATFGRYPRMSPQGDQLAYVKELGRLMLCDLRSGKQRELEVTVDANLLQWHPNSHVIIGAYGNRIRICDTEAGEVDLQEEMELGETPEGEIQHLQFSPDGQTLWVVSAVAGSENDETTLWSIDFANEQATERFTFVHAYYPFVFDHDRLLYVDRPAGAKTLLSYSLKDETRQVVRASPTAWPTRWSESELIARSGLCELIVIDLRSGMTRRLMKLDDDYLSHSGGPSWQKDAPRLRTP